MFNVLIKQAWFTLLMVFAIGCSTLSVASAKTMHVSLAPSESISAPCHHSLSEPRNEIHHHDLSMTSNPSDHCKSIEHHDEACIDCSFSACQSMLSWIDLQSPQLGIITHTFLDETQIPSVSTQNLSGYWQEILRPPKA